jgi:hypothetical protein
MPSHETSDSVPLLRRQCRICLKFFRGMTEAQWRANAPYHVMSIRHQRAIQVRKSSLFAGDPAVLRFEILHVIRQRERSGNPVVPETDLVRVLKTPAHDVERQIEILAHCQLIDVVHVDETLSVRLRPDPAAVIETAERDAREHAL